MLDQESISYDEIIDNRVKISEINKFESNKKKLFIVGIFISFCIIIFSYFVDSSNNIRKVEIKGNKYLSDEYILEYANVDMNSKFLFSSFFVKGRVMKSPFIESVSISLNDYNVMLIEIKEKHMVAYRYYDKLEVIIDDGEIIEVEESMSDIITYLPIVFGSYTKEIMNKIASGLGDLEPHIIENIAEIHPYETTYDQYMLRLLMRDGRNIFSSYYSLAPINYYYDVSLILTEEDHCLYVIEISNHMYSSACPWEEKENKDEKQEKDDE